MQGAAVGVRSTPTHQAPSGEQVRGCGLGFLGNRAHSQHTCATCCSAAISAAKRGLLPLSGCPFSSSAAMVSICAGAIAASGAALVHTLGNMHMTCQRQVWQVMLQAADRP